LVSYKERHVAAYKSYKDEGNPEIDEESRAMDFFDGLDRSKYGDFNNHIMNCIETDTLTPPKDLSTVYGWASNWKRTHNVRDRTSQAAAFVTTEEKDKQGKETHDTPPKLEKDWTNIKCFRCKKKGHGAKWCPEKEAQRKEAERKSAEGNVHLVWADANVMATYSVLSATDEKLAMSNDEILLDTQANISLFHPSILRDVQESEREVRVNGVGGYQMTVSKKGYLLGFFKVYCHDEVKVNVLCFTDVEDLYEVMYQPSVGFVVHVDGKEIIFERQDKLYVAKADDFLVHVMVTVEEKKKEFSSEQVKRAEVAYTLLKNSGYPSPNELIALINNGNITNMPALRREDVLRAYDIYGPLPEYVRGKLTKSKVNRVPVDFLLKADDKVQALWSDVMYIDKNHFFISVADPLQLVIVTHLKDETVNSLGESLQGQLEILRERDFEPVTVYVDPASALMSLRGQFPGVLVDASGAGDHVPKVDIRIRRVKEM
jgi:hypothetical protein